MSKKSVIAVARVVVVAVVALLLPGLVRDRTESSNACINNLRQLDGAKQQWALAHNKATNDVPSWDHIRPYVKLSPSGELPRCTRGGAYTLGRIDEPPSCAVMEHNMSFGFV